MGLGLGIVEIKEQLRHSSIDMTYNVYITQNPLHKKNGYEKRMAKINGNGSATVQTVPQPPATVAVQDQLIDENEALRQLRPLALNYRSLRKYAMGQGMAEQNGGEFLYSSLFISDLASNYFTRAEAIDLLNMPRSTFFYWTKKDAIEFIQIGQVGLFRKDVIMEKRRSL